MSSSRNALPVADFLAITTAGLFAGGAVFISVAEHPARLGLQPMSALAEWRASYAIAAPWQVGRSGSSACGKALKH